MADHRYDVVVGLDYYAPYVSGLTDAARMVAEELARRGTRVLVVAARHDKRLPRRETIAGVDVVRSRVIGRIGKGVIAPNLPFLVARYARRGRVLNLHLPMIESGIAAVLAGSTPIVTTYQCDVSLSGGITDRIARAVMDLSNRVTMGRSRFVVPSSEDYAASSRLSASILPRQVAIAPPTRDRSGGSPSFRDGPGVHIGFLGRVVEEKGIGYLIDGFAAVEDPEARLLIGGDFSSVAGGSVIDSLRRRIEADPRVRLLGFVSEEALPDFYASIDIFALPSVNPLEAFGIVQVEALRLGIPVVATDLPGVRMPVRALSCGRIVPPRDSRAITTALRELAGGAARDADVAARATALYSLEATTERYARLFEEARHVG